MTANTLRKVIKTLTAARLYWYINDCSVIIIDILIADCYGTLFSYHHYINNCLVVTDILNVRLSSYRYINSRSIINISTAARSLVAIII